MADENPFHHHFHNGYFRNLLGWNDLEQFWQTLREQREAGWYLYAVGEQPPTTPVDGIAVERFIDEIDTLLRREHHEDYCGIVYTDSLEEPTLVKIYDPHNLGSVCGSSFGPPTLPGWVVSRLPPVDLQHAIPQTGSRRRWWQNLFHQG